MNLVTVGTRHVKLWRLEGSTPSTPVKLLASFLIHQTSKASHRILSGRNCLLGPLLEGTFTSAVAISQSKAIICSETGDICLLNDSDGRQCFTKIGDAGFIVTAAALISEHSILLAGKSDMIRSFEIEKLLNGDYNQEQDSIANVEEADSGTPFILALAPFGKRAVAVDTRLITPASKDSPGLSEVALQLPAHGGPVLGVRPCESFKVLDASFFTWSAEGTVFFWNSDGVRKKTITVDLEQSGIPDDGALNELRVVRLCGAGSLVTGDKFGVLR